MIIGLQSTEQERIIRNGVKIERLDMNVQELRQFAGRVKNGRVSRRLLAIALVLEGASRKVAAESCGMDRQTSPQKSSKKAFISMPAPISLMNSKFQLDLGKMECSRTQKSS